VVNTLKAISSRYAPSRILSFNSAHVFKTLQLLKRDGHVSRLLLINELGLGEGSIKTLIKHLKMEKLILTTQKGTTMTERGEKIFEEMSQYICAETQVPKCSISIAEYNHAVLLRNLKFAINQGIEQRDAAIKVGAKGATTLLYNMGKFLIPGSKFNALKQEKAIEKLLKDNLKPIENDIIVIGSDDNNYITAELASKSAALQTLENHEDHKGLEYIIR
jgi:hypothetical protein